MIVKFVSLIKFHTRPRPIASSVIRGQPVLCELSKCLNMTLRIDSTVATASFYCRIWGVPSREGGGGQAGGLSLTSL